MERAVSTRGNIDGGGDCLKVALPHSLITIQQYQATEHISNQYTISWPTNTRILKILQLSILLVGVFSRCCPICLVPTVTGYKPAAGKTVDQYRDLDANDESLARWKASLGLDAAVSGDTSGPKVAHDPIKEFLFIYLSLSSPSWAWNLPPPHFPKGGRSRLILLPSLSEHITRTTPYR